MSAPYTKWKPYFLEALRHIPVVAHACEAAGIGRTTAYDARAKDEDFAAAWDDAMEHGVDRAETEAFKRAVMGFEEPVIDKGRLAYRYERYEDAEGNEQFRPVLDENGQPVPLTVRKHSDTMMALILKGRRKKIYADRTEVTGADGAPVQVDETTRSARVAQLLALAQQRKGEADEFGDLA